MNLKDKKILVTGGAGYIGSHIAYALLDQGALPVILDNMSFGYKALVPNNLQIHEIDVRDTKAVTDLMKSESIEGVIHMAALAVVSDSIADPVAYYSNNVEGTASVLKVCEMAGIQSFVFSSSCSVYGSVGEKPANEDHPLCPESPYGESKAMAETVVNTMSKIKGIRSVILRYFNVAGADPEGRSGLLNKKSQRIFMAASRAAVRELDALDVYGNDYDTPDGTAVRDYIHVSDLADIHIEALKYLMSGGETTTINCGYSKGYSVKEIAEGMQRVTGINFPINYESRRQGDPSSVIADTTKMHKILGWTPKYNDLDILLKTSYQWRLKQKNAS